MSREFPYVNDSAEREWPQNKKIEEELFKRAINAGECISTRLSGVPRIKQCILSSDSKWDLSTVIHGKCLHLTPYE